MHDNEHTAVFPLRIKMCISSHAPCRKRQKIVRYTDYTRLGGGGLSAELIHVALLVPRIYRWFLDFWKISGIFVSGMELEAFNWVEIFILL